MLSLVVIGPQIKEKQIGGGGGEGGGGHIAYILPK